MLAKILDQVQSINQRIFKRSECLRYLVDSITKDRGVCFSTKSRFPVVIVVIVAEAAISQDNQQDEKSESCKDHCKHPVSQSVPSFRLLTLAQGLIVLCDGTLPVDGTTLGAFTSINLVEIVIDRSFVGQMQAFVCVPDVTLFLLAYLLCHFRH